MEQSPPQDMNLLFKRKMTKQEFNQLLNNEIEEEIKEISGGLGDVKKDNQLKKQKTQMRLNNKKIHFKDDEEVAQREKFRRKSKRIRISALFEQKEDLNSKKYDKLIQKSLNYFNLNHPLRRYLFKLTNTIYYKRIALLFTLLQIAGFFMIDYTYRKEINLEKYQIFANKISYIFDLICNVVFTVELIVNIIVYGLWQNKYSYFKNKWNTLLFFVLISSWISLFLENQLVNSIKYLRITTFFRHFPNLRMKVNAFFVSFSHLAKTFVPLISIVFLYAVIGMSLFKGDIESRCRLTQYPDQESQTWEVDPNNELPCGFIDCPDFPVLTYCGNPIDYDLPPNHSEYNNEKLLFGFPNFDNFQSALFTVYTFFMVSGWISITQIYWRAQQKEVAAIYFASLVLVTSQIFSNIILATLYEGFLNQTHIKHGPQVFYNQKKQKKKVGNNSQQLRPLSRQDPTNQDEKNGEHKNQIQLQKELKIFSEFMDTEYPLNEQQEQNQSDLKSKFQKEKKKFKIRALFVSIQKSPYTKLLFFANNLMSLIVLCLDYSGISDGDYRVLNCFDFIAVLILFLEIIIAFVANGIKQYFKNNINILNCLILIAHIVSYLFEVNMGYDIFFPIKQPFILVRCTKIMRSFQLLYNYQIFETWRVILDTYYYTLQTIPEYLIVSIILILVVSQIGRELFSQYIPESELELIRINFESLPDSIIASIMILYNEEYYISMYFYAEIVGAKSIIFYLFTMLILYVLFMRLFIALFINHFMKWLEQLEKEKLNSNKAKQNKSDYYTYFKLILQRCFYNFFSKPNSKKKNQVSAVNIQINTIDQNKNEINNLKKSSENLQNQIQNIQNLKLGKTSQLKDKIIMSPKDNFTIKSSSQNNSSYFKKPSVKSLSCQIQDGFSNQFLSPQRQNFLNVFSNIQKRPTIHGLLSNQKTNTKQPSKLSQQAEKSEQNLKDSPGLTDFSNNPKNKQENNQKQQNENFKQRSDLKPKLSNLFSKMTKDNTSDTQSVNQNNSVLNNQNEDVQKLFQSNQKSQFNKLLRSDEQTQKKISFNMENYSPKIGNFLQQDDLDQNNNQITCQKDNNHLHDTVNENEKSEHQETYKITQDKLSECSKQDSKYLKEEDEKKESKKSDINFNKFENKSSEHLILHSSFNKIKEKHLKSNTIMNIPTELTETHCNQNNNLQSENKFEEITYKLVNLNSKNINQSSENNYLEISQKNQQLQNSQFSLAQKQKKKKLNFFNRSQSVFIGKGIENIISHKNYSYHKENSDSFHRIQAEEKQEQQSVVQNIEEDLSKYQSKQIEEKEESIIVKIYSILLSKKFDFAMIVFFIFHAVIFVLDSPYLNTKSHLKLILLILQGILSFLQIFINVNKISNLGLLNYLTQNYTNIVDLATSITCFVYVFPLNKEPLYYLKLINIFRLFLVLIYLAKYNEQIKFAGKLLQECAPRMKKLITFTILYLLMMGIITTKLLKGQSYQCTFPFVYGEDKGYQELVVSKADCLDLGGDWMESDYNYDNIIKSVQILYNIQSSEGWSQIMFDTYDSQGKDLTHQYQSHSYWAIFFIQFYFIAFVCFLNMFVGLMVESFNELLEKENLTHTLNPQQKEWYFIKQSIYGISPNRQLAPPDNIISKFIFQHLIKGYALKIITYIFILLNGISFLFFKSRMARTELENLYLINKICLSVFSVEFVLNLIAIQRQFLISKTNFFNLTVIIIGWLNLNFQLNKDVKTYNFNYRILDGVAKGLQLIRAYIIFRHFVLIRKLFKSLHYAISSIKGVLIIVVVFLYTSVLLSLNLFPYLKSQEIINYYDNHFQTFYQATFTLIRIVTSEAWYLIPLECSQQQQPNFVCRNDMHSYDDYVQFGLSSCGTSASFFFYYFFYLFFTLVILNIFIATIIESYKQSFKADESAITHYQMDDILELWTAFDPQGKGYITYKQFWKFSSQIAIIYGVDSKELLDIENKQKFLQTLNIPIFEDPENKIFCYKFHDVVISLSRISVSIKYGVNNLEPEDENLNSILEQKIVKSKLKGESLIKPTNLTSSDMILIIILSSKVRLWKKKFVDKNHDSQFYSNLKNITMKLKNQLNTQSQDIQLANSKFNIQN
ncbi:hypothetical protein ABPG74_005038 [Tetrahymena malaccensis]